MKHEVLKELLIKASKWDTIVNTASSVNNKILTEYIRGTSLVFEDPELQVVIEDRMKELKQFLTSTIYTSFVEAVVEKLTKKEKNNA